MSEMEMGAVSIGIDPSLTSTGLAVIVDGELVEHLSVPTSPKDGPNVYRISKIQHEIQKLLKKYQDQEPVIAVEGYAFAFHKSQAFTLGEVGGVVRNTLYNAGWSYYDVPPTNLKKYATGKGNSSKDKVVEEAQNLFEKTFDTDDEADAAFLAKMAKSLKQEEDELTDNQKSSLKKCEYVVWQS
jgi:crossover junction endodeoxyribonuclease RuvC